MGDSPDQSKIVAVLANEEGESTGYFGLDQVAFFIGFVGDYSGCVFASVVHLLLIISEIPEECLESCFSKP